MQGRTRTARPETETLEAGTYQLTLERAFVTVGYPADKYLKPGKTKEESAYAQMCLVWIDAETQARVRDNFLKMPDHLEFSGEERFKSKFQKRLEGMINKKLVDESGNDLNLKFDFIEEWDELMEAIKETENGKPVQVDVKGMTWAGHEMFGREWLVAVDVTDKGYNNVSTVTPLPKRRAPAAQQAQPAPATTAAPQQQAAPAPQPPARPAPAQPEPTEEDMPF